VSSRDQILECLTEPKTIQQVVNDLNANYHTIKNMLVTLKMEGYIHAYKDSQDRLMHYYVPQPHPLQTIFGHTVNFTPNQIKGVISHNADDAKHNLQHKTTQETYGESVAYTLTRYD
jgi:hypothetical protein